MPLMFLLNIGTYNCDLISFFLKKKTFICCPYRDIDNISFKYILNLIHLKYLL